MFFFFANNSLVFIKSFLAASAQSSAANIADTTAIPSTPVSFR